MSELQTWFQMFPLSSTQLASLQFGRIGGQSVHEPGAHVQGREPVVQVRARCIHDGVRGTGRRASQPGGAVRAVCGDGREKSAHAHRRRRVPRGLGRALSRQTRERPHQSLQTLRELRRQREGARAECLHGGVVRAVRYSVDPQVLKGDWFQMVKHVN